MFLKKHATLIEDLMNNRSKYWNRFRQLLLGTKAIGKTSILKVLKEFEINYVTIIS
jgi:GTPase SAR1 family protein